jgi:MFS family permease
MGGLPAAFWLFAVASAVCTAGLVTFGLISFHLVDAGIVPAAGAPLLYAAAMAAGAVAALLTGEAYDRVGPRTLLALPVLVAAVTAAGFRRRARRRHRRRPAVGAAVACRTPRSRRWSPTSSDRTRRATAFGLFAAVQGVGALAGGIATGALYEHSIRDTRDRRHRHPGPSPPPSSSPSPAARSPPVAGQARSTEAPARRALGISATLSTVASKWASRSSGASELRSTE